jgi:hypothetical protein
MAANTAPVFTDTPHMGLVMINTANTNRDGTGSLGDVITGTTDGTRVDRVVIKAGGTTTNGMVRVYLYNGTNTMLWDEVFVPAITASNTAVTFKSTIQSPDLMSPLIVLASGQKIQVSTVQAETFYVTAHGADY